MINEFKYGQTSKIWPSLSSLLLYNPFKFLDSQHKISVVLWLLYLFEDSTNKSKAFNLKVNCKELKLVFLYYKNTKCT